MLTCGVNQMKSHSELLSDQLGLCLGQVWDTSYLYSSLKTRLVLPMMITTMSLVFFLIRLKAPFQGKNFKSILLILKTWKLGDIFVQIQIRGWNLYYWSIAPKWPEKFSYQSRNTITNFIVDVNFNCSFTSDIIDTASSISAWSYLHTKQCWIDKITLRFKKIFINLHCHS